jgi:hypothetical protein
VWDVHEITLQPPHYIPKFEAALERVFCVGEWDGLKIVRERAALGHLCRQADQEVLAVAIEVGKISNYIANVGANAEFRHATDVNGDVHSVNLIIASQDGDRKSKGHPQACGLLFFAGFDFAQPFPAFLWQSL